MINFRPSHGIKHEIHSVLILKIAAQRFFASHHFDVFFVKLKKNRKMIFLLPEASGTSFLSLDASRSNFEALLGNLEKL